jgi:hypothetical protein
MKTAKYFLAKYIPDMQRFEPRNIGVVVWSPLGIEARFLAENPNRLGDVDGRSIPDWVTSHNAYRQWVRYWRDALAENSIEPLRGGERIGASSPAFMDALRETAQGNFMLIESGAVMDRVDEEDLPAVANQLFAQLVLEATLNDEPKDRSFEARCDELLMKTQLMAHRHFQDRYPVKCTVRGVEEEYIFSHALANGTIERLFQRFPFPKTKGRIQKSRDAMAWALESLSNSKIITPDKTILIIDVTPEQRSQPEVDKTLHLLGSMSHVVNMQEPADAEVVFAEAAKLT